jgi:molecular chaperone GrpE (heat shock protein)
MENNKGGTDLENSLDGVSAQNINPVNKPSDISDNQESILNTEENTKTNKNDSNQPLLKEYLLSITSFLNKLEKDLNLRNERDKYKDEAIQRMSKQIEEYEKGFVKKIKEPLIRDLIMLCDTIEKLHKKFCSSGNADLNHEIVLLKEEVDEILFASGVERIELSGNPEYDINHQKIVLKVPTNNPEENMRICKIVRDGYLWDKSLIRKQEITVYEFITNITKG